MERVAALVHDYVPPDPQKLQAAQAGGRLRVQPSPDGIVILETKDYVNLGDSLSIRFDSALKLSSYHRTSYVENPKDDDVTLAVTFWETARRHGVPAASVARRQGEADPGEGDQLGSQVEHIAIVSL